MLQELLRRSVLHLTWLTTLYGDAMRQMVLLHSDRLRVLHGLPRSEGTTSVLRILKHCELLLYSRLLALHKLHVLRQVHHGWLLRLRRDAAH